jgi:hypothetical protein
MKKTSTPKDKETQIPEKQNQDDPNKLQKPNGRKEKYIPEPKTSHPDEDNPGRDYDQSGS